MKKLLLILAIPVVLILGAVVAVPMLVDPNQFKGEITKLIKEKTGREVTVNGTIKLSIFPWAGVALTDVVVGDAPGFGSDPMARVQQLEVRAQLMPLLSKRLEADKITVDGLVLKLAKDAKGRANWEDLTGAGKATPPPAAAKGDPKTAPTGQATPTPPAAVTPAAPTAGGGMGLESITLAGVEIKNSQVTWSNGVSGAQYLFKGVTLSTGALSPGQPVALELKTDVERAKPATRATLTVTTTVVLSGDGKSVKLQKSKLGLNVKGGEGAPVNQAELQLAAEIEAALNGSTVKLTGMDATLTTEGGSTPLAKSASHLQGNVELSPTRIVVGGLNWTLKGMENLAGPSAMWRGVTREMWRVSGRGWP
ncbi:MAG: AsmA family protein [Magnetococcales bacterium]|nr:AsmA family protein [Magnetococcales bacterium]